MDSASAVPTILVVDDDHDNADIVRHLLISKGYKVLVAFDGDEALAIFDETRPALVILDVMMPGRSGWEVCRVMKQHPLHGRLVRIIMLTALDAWDDKQVALQTGADDYMTKPLNLAQLLDHVQRNLALVAPAV